MIPILSVSNLTKVYGKKKVVNNVNFSVFAGQIFGFVGPTGAGKSTTIRMITGLTPITNGDVRICGYSIKTAYKKAISRVGGIIEMPQLYPYLTGMKNLKLFAGFYGKAALARINPIVKLVGMENRINEKVSTYSLGMKQRLGIAQALLSKPQLLILDEPTNGLDPNGIVEMRHILKTLAEKLAAKAVRTGRKVTLEPMNPFERRVIHSALTNNTEVTITEGKMLTSKIPLRKQQLTSCSSPNRVSLWGQSLNYFILNLFYTIKQDKYLSIPR